VESDYRARRGDILEALRLHGPAAPTDLADLVGWPLGTIYNDLHALGSAVKPIATERRRVQCGRTRPYRTRTLWGVADPHPWEDDGL
jgi:DeoR/GlpR family transcriptional regulator of sugar metabolism